MSDLYYGRIFLSIHFLVANCLIVACSPRQAPPNENPLGSQTRGNGNTPLQPFKDPSLGEEQRGSTDTCGQEGGSCAPMSLSVNFAGTYAESSNVKFWFGTRGVPVNWQVRISDFPDRPFVASIKLRGAPAAKFEQAGSSEGMTTYKVKYTPQSTVEASEAVVLIRDVKHCLTITKNTNMCNSASGSADGRYDTEAIFAFRIESTPQAQGPNTSLQIFSCVAQAIGTLAGGQASQVTGAINQGLGENGCK